MLVVALLVCHGAAGGLHQAAMEPSPSEVQQLPAQWGPVDGHSTGHSTGHSAQHVDYVAYLAAFFVALLGTFLRPSFGISGRRYAAPLSTPRTAFATPLLCRGLAPTAPNLQVFRL